MNWQSLIATIRARGLTQVQIALACKCGQATISELERGKNENPSFRLGQSLLALSKASDQEIEAILAQDAKAV